MTNELSLQLPDPDATRRLGAALGEVLVPGLVVGLVGDLGAGKTSLVKAAVAAQGSVQEDDVVSPTFALAINYPGRVPTLHVDVYRLEGPGDFQSLDLPLGPESSHTALIEWAEKVEDALPPDRLTIILSHNQPGRSAEITASGAQSAQVLAALRPLLSV